MLACVTTDGGSLAVVAGVGLLVVLLVVLLVDDDAVAAFAFELSLLLEFELLLELELDCELELELELEFEFEFELELELATFPGLLLVPVRKTEKAFGPPPWKNVSQSIDTGHQFEAGLTHITSVTGAWGVAVRIGSLAICRWQLIPTIAIGASSKCHDSLARTLFRAMK